MIILDASAVVEMARDSDVGQALKRLYRRNEKTASCNLILAELASVWRMIAIKERMSSEMVELRYLESLGLVDVMYPLEDLRTEALHESIRLNHSVYDMFYFVLARRTGGTLFTADAKLMDLCRANGVNCLTQSSVPENR